MPRSARGSARSAARRSPRWSSPAAWSSGPSVAAWSPAAGRAARPRRGAALSIYPCPDSGPALARVGSGQKFLVTGKNADGSWVRIYYPLPDRTEAWVTSGPLQINGSLDGHPGRALLAGDRRTGRPGPARARRSPRSRTTARRPAPTGSEAPPSRRRTARRTWRGSRRRRARSRADRSATAPIPPRSVTVSVRVTDTEPIASVVLSYRRPGLSGYATKPMARGGGANTWQATLRTDTDGIDTAGDLRFFVTATDANPSPRSARLPADGSRVDHGRRLREHGPDGGLAQGEPGDGVHEPRGPARTTRRRRRSRRRRPTSTASRAMTLHYHAARRRRRPPRRR